MSIAIPYRNTSQTTRPPLAVIALLALIAVALGVWVWLNPGDLKPIESVTCPSDLEFDRTGTFSRNDQFWQSPAIANDEQTGRGIGSSVLVEFVRDVIFATPRTRACIAGPDADNSASIRAFEKAGFTAGRKFREPDDDNRLHVLMRLDR